MNKKEKRPEKVEGLKPLDDLADGIPQGQEFIFHLLMGLLTEGNGDVIYLNLHSAAEKVGMPEEELKKFWEKIQKHRHENNIFVRSGFCS